MARLGDICEILDSKRVPITAKDRVSGPYPYYGANGVQDYVASYIFDDELVLLAEDGGHFGSSDKPIAYRVSGKCWVNNHAHVLKPKACIDVDYLCYSLMFRDVSDIVNGATRQKLTQADMREINIPLPTFEEQKKVVAKIGKVFELIALRKEQLAKLDELIKSRFIELFGDPVDNPKDYLVKSLQELIDMGYITYHLDGNHGGDYPRSEEFVDSGVPYIGANSIVNGEIDFSMAKFLAAERADKLRKGIAQNDDVLFAHNATVGPTVVLKTTEPKVILSTSLTAYRCNKSRLLPNYLKAYMQSDGFVRQYSGEMKQTTRNQVPITAQKKYLFLVPPIVEQKQFAIFVEQTDKSKLAIQQSLDKLELLKKSLMQEYFG